MRTKTIAILIVLGFVLVAAGAALAQPNQTAREERMANAKARHDALAAARNASLASFHENRTAAIEAFHAANNATKASFIENKTRVQAECRALANTTGNETGGCVRDGLKPLIEKARAEHQAAKDAFRAAMLAARTNAMEQFRAAREAWRAEHSG